jgi:hypothetical protein
MKVAIRGNAERGTLTIRYGDKQLDALWRALTMKSAPKPRPVVDEDDDDGIVT